MEHDPTDEERSEAEALGRALERGSGSSGLPEDALEAAALLRYSADGGELGLDRSRAILDELLATAKMPEPAKPRSAWRFLAWLVPAMGLATAVGVVSLVVFGPAAEPASRATATALPVPSADLLAAQAAAARGDADAAGRLDLAMRSHRQQLLAALTEHYRARHASRQEMLLAPALLAAVGPPVLVLATTGCAEQPASETATWLSNVRDAHARAEAAIDAGDLDAARDALTAGLALGVPAVVDASDRRVVQQDLHWALAEVELDAGDVAAALGEADAGLELGREEDLYTANLLVARGRALVASGREVDAASDYYEALEINDALLRRTLGTEEGG